MIMHGGDSALFIWMGLAAIGALVLAVGLAYGVYRLAKYMIERN